MSCGRRSRWGRSPPALGLSFGLLVTALAVTARPGSAQITVAQAEEQRQNAQAVLDQRLGEYRSAFEAYEISLDQVEASRGTPAYEGALARFTTLAVQAMDAQTQADAAAVGLEAARRTLLAVLDARDVEILAVLELETNPERRAQLLSEWDQNGERADQLEAAGSQIEEQIALRPAPELTVTPRDTPSDLSFKAAFMEERASQYDVVITWIEGEIALVEARILQMQNAAGLLQGLRRYDSDISPGGQLGTDARPPSTEPNGSAPSILAGRSLPDQLDIFQDLFVQTILYRDRARTQAQVFRELATVGSP